MKIFIVFAHPEPKSFNGALLFEAQKVFVEQHHEVKISDLYAMMFNPVISRKDYTNAKDPDYFKPQIEQMNATETGGFAPDIEGEIRKIEWCDLMLWQFPLWWFGLPGVLKGWVDRVLAMGRTYGGGRLYETGVFKGKRALLSLTTGGPADAYVKGGFNGDIQSILRPIQKGMLKFVGFDVLAANIIYAPVRMKDEERKNILEKYAQRLRQIHVERAISVGDY